MTFLAIVKYKLNSLPVKNLTLIVNLEADSHEHAKEIALEYFSSLEWVDNLDSFEFNIISMTTFSNDVPSYVWN